MAEERWTSVLKEAKKHQICFTTIDINRLTTGSSMRRVAPHGVKYWVDEFRDTGFNKEMFHLRVYIADQAQTDLLKAALPDKETLAKFYEEQGLTPASAPSITTLPDSVTCPLKLLDGQHRWKALLELRETHKDKLYATVRVQIFGPGVIPEIGLYSKAVNSQVSRGVQEDILER